MLEPWHEMILSDNSFFIAQASPAHAADVVDYYRRNRQHLQMWEPLRHRQFYLESTWFALLKHRQKACLFEKAAHWLIYEAKKKEVIGCINLMPLENDDPQILNLGYSMDFRFQGQGIMSNALQNVIDDAFERLEFSGIEAAYLPENHVSQYILKRLGFKRVKQERRFYPINGMNRAHICVYKENLFFPWL